MLSAIFKELVYLSRLRGFRVGNSILKPATDEALIEFYHRFGDLF